MATAFITHPACGLHEMGPQHPESPERLTAITDQLVASDLDSRLAHHEAPRASAEQLTRVHPQAFVAAIEAASPRSGLHYIDPDTALNGHSVEAAYRAAGALVRATDLVMNGECANAFCAVRPPGHHAESNRAMGFCLFNNVAVGIAHAMAAHDVKRAAVIDFDVHHGNGTEEIFAGDSRVLMVSTFQYPLYPYSGVEPLGANMVNIPLSAGAGGAEFRAAVSDHWLPALDRMRPEILFISAGFDAHREDPLAGLNLVEDDYAWVTAELSKIAKRHAQGRIVSTLEGGYALSALGRSAVAHIRQLTEA